MVGVAAYRSAESVRATTLKRRVGRTSVEILSTAAPEVIAGFLGVLAAATGMDLLDDWLPSFAEDG